VKRPKDVATMTKLGELHLRGGNPYMAQMVLGKALEISETGAILNLLGVAAGRLGDLQDALELFDKAVKREPGFGPAHANKAALLQSFGYTAEARAEAKKLKAGESWTEGDPKLLPGAAQAVGSLR
jgi:Flp pilus assembly protein TadD